MAGLLNNTAKDLMLDALDESTAIAYASLHSDDPSTTGANEISGGTPAYARKAITWDAATAASKAQNGSCVFDVPPSTAVKYVGLWSAATSGTYYGYITVTEEDFAGQGTYTFSGGTISVS
jgi:hypothetical protein